MDSFLKTAFASPLFAQLHLKAQSLHDNPFSVDLNLTNVAQDAHEEEFQEDVTIQLANDCLLVD